MTMKKMGQEFDGLSALGDVGGTCYGFGLEDKLQERSC